MKTLQLNQKNLVDKNKFGQNTQKFLHTLQLNSKHKNPIDCYSELLEKFSLLRCVINLKNNECNILSYNKIYFNIQNCTCDKFTFNYDGNTYLTSLVQDNDKFYLVFNYIFLDRLSLELIQTYLASDENEKNALLEKMNSSCAFFPAHKILKYELEPININLLKQNFEQSDFTNEIIEIDVDEKLFLNVSNFYNVSQYELHFGIINLIFRSFSEITNNYVIFDYSDGRTLETSYALGHFSFPREIKYENVDELTLGKYFSHTHEELTRPHEITTRNISVIINDLRKTSTLHNCFTINKNDIFADVSVDVLSNNNFSIGGKIKKISNMKNIFQNMYDTILLQKNKDIKIKLMNAIENDITKNNTDYEYVNPVLIYLENTLKNFHKTAVILNDVHITHGELYMNAKIFANKYLKNIQKNTVIPIYSKKNIELIIAIMAIFISGLAYCPLDENIPEDILKETLENINAQYIITNHINKFSIPSFYPEIEHIEKSKFIDISYETEKVLIPFIEPTDISYVIYTSGSTGKSKGIIQQYLTLYNLSKWEDSFFTYCAKGSLLTHSFDLFVLDVFGTLIYSKTLIIINDLSKLDNLKHVDTLSTTSTFLNYIKKDILKNNLTSIVLLGEKINMTREDYLMYKDKKIQIHNMYGPTETGVISVAKYDLSYEETINQNIGKPVSNMFAHILDKNMLECSNNVIGEICVSGPQLFSGYIDKNIPTNLVKTIYGTIYKTGDYGLLNDKDEIEYIGRIDNQIKRNGVRIELHQIDNILMKHPHVEQSVSIFKNQQIITLVQLQNEVIPLTEKMLFDYLVANINVLYVPNKIIKVNKFDYNKNGKIILSDKALQNLKTNSETTLGLTNDTLLEKFKQTILDTFQINITDPDKYLYFYGFDSLKIIHLTKILNEKFSANFTGAITLSSSLSKLVNIKSQEPEYMVFKDAGSDYLILLFRDGYGWCCNELGFIDGYDILIIQNFLFISSLDPFDKKFEELENYCKKKQYKKIFIYADCAGCIQAIPFLHLAEKVIFDSPVFDRYFPDEQIKKKMYQTLKHFNKKIYYYFGNKTDFAEINTLKTYTRVKNTKMYHSRRGKHVFYLNVNNKHIFNDINSMFRKD